MGEVIQDNPNIDTVLNLNQTCSLTCCSLSTVALNLVVCTPSSVVGDTCGSCSFIHVDSYFSFRRRPLHSRDVCGRNLRYTQLFMRKELLVKLLYGRGQVDEGQSEGTNRRFLFLDFLCARDQA